MLLVQVNDKAAYFQRLKILNVSLKYICPTVFNKQYRTVWSPILVAYAR